MTAATYEHPHCSTFSYDYMRWFVRLAQSNGYRFYTCKEFLEAGSPRRHAFVMKHDLDAKPATLPGLLALEKELGIRSTVYVRVTANDYNVMSYLVMPALVKAERDGFEVGLHTNFLEYATINGLDPVQVLTAEVNLLKEFLNVRGVSTHRDLNYAYNALPWLEERWTWLSRTLDLDYQAYDRRLMDNTTYVNEGYSPHLCWRNKKPEEAIATGDSVYMLTHNHWWFKDHPFETW